MPIPPGTFNLTDYGGNDVGAASRGFFGDVMGMADRANAGSMGGGRGGGYGGGRSGPSSAEMDLQRQQLEMQKQFGAADRGLAAQKFAFDQNKFNTVWGSLAGLQHSLMGGAATAGGGPVGRQPTINAGPVYTPDQTNQQVNSMRSRSDAETQNQKMAYQNRAGGMGYAPSSPLLNAMDQRFDMANMMNKTGNERELRLGAAKDNAGQLLKGQQAQEAQYANRQTEDIERRKPYFQNMNAWISALSGLA